MSIQFLRGTTSQIASYTGSPGEIVVDTDTNELYLQDGVTAGGHRIPNLASLDTILLDKVGIEKTGPGEYTLHGNLTISGI